MGVRGPVGNATWRLGATAGMASYLDAGALIATGLALGGFYVDPLDLSRATVGLLLGFQTLAFAAGALVGGHLGDRVGRRRVLLASLVLYACGTSMLAAATGPEMLAAGVLLSGLGIGGDLPTSLAMIGEEAPPGAKGRLLALSQLLWVAGIATAAVLGLVLADLGALAGRALFTLFSVVAMVVLLLRFQLRESHEWSTAAATRREIATGHRPLSLPWRPVCVLGGFYIAWLVSANTLGQFRPYIWIETLDGSARGASALVLLGLPLGVVGGLLFMRSADQPQRHAWVLAGGWVCIAGWAILSVWPGRTSFVVLCVLFGFGASLSGEVAYKIWVQQHVPTLARASVQGLTLALARTVAAAVAAVTPTAIEMSPRAFFSAITLTTLAAVLVAHRLVPRLDEA